MTYLIMFLFLILTVLVYGYLRSCLYDPWRFYQDQKKEELKNGRPSLLYLVENGDREKWLRRSDWYKFWE